MREIKFRGHALHDSCGQKVDKFVFGDLCQGDGLITILDWDDGDNYEVEPETVAQLVGYDTNGKEVYEGDTVVGEDGMQWNADWSYILISDDGFEHSLDLEFFTLKEDD